MFSFLLITSRFSSDLSFFITSSFKVRTNFRTAITIPEKFWPKFRDTVNDIIGEYQDNKKGSKEDKTDANGVREPLVPSWK